MNTFGHRLMQLIVGVGIGLTIGCGVPGNGTDDGGPSEPLDAGEVADGGTAFDAGVAVDAGAPIDAGSTNDAGVVMTGPIDAPADKWSWVDFPESKCASGTATGIGINPHRGSTKVLIYFEGGGACSSATSCWGADPRAANLDGFDGTTFASGARQLTLFPIFSRTNAANPLKDANMVFVPYCTGDMHAGTAVVDLMVNGTVKPTYFWGARDLDIFLARLVPTFSTAERVWVMGGSAGGYATVLTFDNVTRAFNGIRVDIVNDSGPSIVSKLGSDNEGLFNRWGVVAPAGCIDCKSHEAMLAFDRKSQPNSKFAFLSYDQDTVLSKDLGYTLDEYPAVLQQFFTDSLAGDANAATFIVTNKQSHVVQSDLLNASAYLPWLAEMVNDNPAWASKTFVHP